MSDTEVREWLYRFAKENQISVTEFKSGQTHFAHLQDSDHYTATAVAKNKTTALLLAFLNKTDKRFTFL